MIFLSNFFFVRNFRNVAMGGCTFWTRAGGMIAPQILLLVSLFICNFILVVAPGGPKDIFKALKIRIFKTAE